MHVIVHRATKSLESSSRDGSNACKHHHDSALWCLSSRTFSPCFCSMGRTSAIGCITTMVMMGVSAVHHTWQTGVNQQRCCSKAPTRVCSQTNIDCSDAAPEARPTTPSVHPSSPPWLQVVVLSVVVQSPSNPSQGRPKSASHGEGLPSCSHNQIKQSFGHQLGSPSCQSVSATHLPPAMTRQPQSVLHMAATVIPCAPLQGSTTPGHSLHCPTCLKRDMRLATGEAHGK